MQPAVKITCYLSDSNPLEKMIITLAGIISHSTLDLKVVGEKNNLPSIAQFT